MADQNNVARIGDNRSFGRKMVERDKCPQCHGELDTGYECNDCGFDALPLLPPLPRPA